MRKFVLSLGLGFIVNNAVGALVAAVVLQPLLNPMFVNTVRTEEQGLAFPSLLGGYFLLTLLMVIGYRYFSLRGGWLKKGVAWGLLIGSATFLSGHMIVAGWSILPSLPMLISGILDILAPVAAGVVIAYCHGNGGSFRE